MSGVGAAAFTRGGHTGCRRLRPSCPGSIAPAAPARATTSRTTSTSRRPGPPTSARRTCTAAPADALASTDRRLLAHPRHFAWLVGQLEVAQSWCQVRGLWSPSGEPDRWSTSRSTASRLAHAASTGGACVWASSIRKVTGYRSDARVPPPVQGGQRGGSVGLRSSYRGWAYRYVDGVADETVRDSGAAGARPSGTGGTWRSRPGAAARTGVPATSRSPDGGLRRARSSVGTPSGSRGPVFQAAGPTGRPCRAVAARAAAGAQGRVARSGSPCGWCGSRRRSVTPGHLLRVTRAARRREPVSARSRRPGRAGRR